jgi:NAD-dependent SIR2 family protein deacetylase
VTTRLIEVNMGCWGEDLAWECEQCKESWVYIEGLPKDTNVNYCPACGKKITEYVGYVEEED